MPLKKRPTQNGEEEGEWIMSYADTVTLLLCFFVIFFSESKYGEDSDKENVSELASQVKAEQILTIEIQKEEKRLRDHLEALKSELNARLMKESLTDYELVQDQRNISIRLKEQSFFKVGSFKVLPRGRNILKKISKSLKNMEEDVAVHVEGHTDSKPVRSSAYYSSNLGLSSLRASKAAEVLVQAGFLSEKITVLGYGDSRPVAIDRSVAAETGRVVYDEEKAQKNRRIEIRLISQKFISRLKNQ